jgi:hypothetical protein
MNELGLSKANGTGKHSTAARLKDQMTRLFTCLITFSTSGEFSEGRFENEASMQIANNRFMWWEAKNPDQKSLWESFIDLDPRFYNAITTNAVPVDLRALRAIKSSPLALDLYSLLTYHAYRASEVVCAPVFLGWRDLQDSLGTSYADPANLKKAIHSAMVKIESVYPSLAIGDREGGLEIRPESATAIEKR